MRTNKHEEATKMFEAMLTEAESGNRELLGGTVRLDSVPAWKGTSEHKLDGSMIHALYLAYRKATDDQKKQADSAKLSGLDLEELRGRVIDLRRCKDGTIQVLMTNGLRDGAGKPAFRSFNIHKGIVLAFAIDEGLGTTMNEAVSRAPEDEIAKLKAAKGIADRRIIADVKPKPDEDPVKAYADALEKRTKRRPKVTK
jgi:hypothetical protein